MSDAILRLRTGARIEPCCGDKDVDCRLLFGADRVRQLVRTYEEAVYRLSQPRSHAGLARFLAESAEITQSYDLDTTADRVGLTLKDDWFRRAGSLDDLVFALKATADGHEHRFALPLERFAAAGHLVPLLTGDRREDRIRDGLRATLDGEDLAWTEALLEGLISEGFVERAGEPTPNPFLREGPQPRVTLVAHTSLLVESGSTAVLFDPLLPRGFRARPEIFDVARLRLSGICLSHSHWDHCDVATLLRFDKRTPVFVPRVVHATLFNPPIVPMLKRLGFSDIREVDHWRPEQIGDIEMVPVPFHGEQDEPDADIDHYTYVVRTGPLCFYGGVDAFRDSSSDMDADLTRVREAYRPTVAFLPVSQMTYDYRSGGVNGFCRTIHTGLLDESFQYTAGPDVAAAWADLLGVRWVVPYATFTFDGRHPARETVTFGELLSRKAREDSFIPLAPLDRLDMTDLTDGGAQRRGALRRQLRVADRRHQLEERWQQSLIHRALRRLSKSRTSAPAADHHH